MIFDNDRGCDGVELIRVSSGMQQRKVRQKSRRDREMTGKRRAGRDGNAKKGRREHQTAVVGTSRH